MYQQLGKLQIQLSSALKYDNLLSSKILKMVALNVFVVEHNKLKGKDGFNMLYHF